jgi:hypothetical protein
VSPVHLANGAAQEEIPERLTKFIMDITKEDICHVKPRLFPLVVDFDKQKPCKEESLTTDADELYSYRTFLIMLGGSPTMTLVCNTSMLTILH